MQKANSHSGRFSNGPKDKQFDPIRAFLDSLCPLHRHRITKVLNAMVRELALLKGDRDYWEDKAKYSEDQICKIAHAFIKQKAEIRKALKNMGIPIKRGSELNRILIKFHDE